MNTTPPEQLRKLPKWAQDRITRLERIVESQARGNAELVNRDNEGPIALENWTTGKEGTPTMTERKYQARRVIVGHNGVRVDIQLLESDPERGIEINLGTDDQIMFGDVIFRANSHNQFSVIHPKYARS